VRKTISILFAFTLVTSLGLLMTGIVAAAQATTDWVEYGDNPVFDPVERAYYPSILKDGDVYHMWYDAPDLRMTTSTDGITWQVGVATSGLTNARHSVVKKIGAEYRIWYWDAAKLYTIEAIRTARSADGITWTNDQPIQQIGSTVITGVWPDPNRGSYGPGDVLYDSAGASSIVAPVDAASVWANKYVMYYEGTDGGTEQVFLAVSADGITWHGYQDGVAPVIPRGGSGQWDATHVYPGTVIRETGSSYHMWYSGGDGSVNHGIGYAHSTDGVSWARDSENPILHVDDGVAWRIQRTYTPIVIGNEMWFTGQDASNNYAIGYATGYSAPSVPECIETATGSGIACLATVDGTMVDLVAVAAPGLPSVAFPHGMFSFRITGLTTGQMVDVTVTLPSNIPVGTVWWKYDNGSWSSLPNLNDNGDNIMVIRLTDGGVGDSDNIPGQITDPGGPGNPMTVGWDGSPVSRAGVVLPWIALLAAMVAGAGLFVWKRRRVEI
jgi:hypothetical protein